jgi:hypothetical protein
MKIGDFKIIFNDGELKFFDKEDKFLFSLGFKGNIFRLQELLNDNPKKLKISLSLFPFGIGIWDISGEKIGVITLRLW